MYLYYVRVGSFVAKLEPPKTTFPLCTIPNRNYGDHV
jgi:hypothetical protein